MKSPKSTLLILTIFLFQISFAQNYKFGKVSKEELEEAYYPLDSSANAAYLYKERKTYSAVYGNGLQLVTEIYTRLKVYNKEGFKWATEEIKLYAPSNSDSENISSLKAYTYNLEDGKIVETKLDKDNVFTEKTSDNWTTKKFTMPNLKEGSVVEWSYKIISPYFMYVDDVVVQYEIPVKNFEARVQLLEWFYFNKRQKGYYFFKMNESSKSNIDLRTNDRLIEISEKNIPAIKEEPFINNINNYTAALQLEVASLSAPTLGLFETYATSWEEIAKNIYKSSSFGGELGKTGHLKDDLAILKSKLTTNEAKIGGALDYVKSKIKWNGNYGVYTEKGGRKSYNENTGNVGDINLTLVNVLSELGLKANPVLVSTRSHGIPIFPTSRGFNYVIAAVEIDGGVYLLDATNQFSTPNVLPVRALNWQGRLVRENGTSAPIELFPKEQAKENVFAALTIDSEGLLTGKVRTSYTNQLALNYRESRNSLTEDELIEKLESNFSGIEITKVELQNKEDLYKPLIVNLEFEAEDMIETIGDKIYVSPLVFFAKSENPFKLDKREYPIDFGTPWDEKYAINISLPEGYAVESIPESISLALPDNLGSFKFLCKPNGNKLQVLSEIEINTPIIGANNYEIIKGFYKMIIDKQQEKVVLSKN